MSKLALWRIFFPFMILFQPRSTASNPSSTSSATPPFSKTLCIIAAIIFLFAPPLGGCQTPSVSTFSECCIDPAADPPVAVFKKLGTPGGVKRDGGSIVLTDNNLRSLAGLESISIASVSVLDAPVDLSPTDTANTTSATASSSLLGSKIILSCTAMTNNVTGGLA